MMLLGKACSASGRCVADRDIGPAGLAVRLGHRIHQASYVVVLAIAAFMAPAIAQPNPGTAPVGFAGSASYSINGNQVVLRADSIYNHRTTSQSTGTLRLELWAFTSPFGQASTGYKVAQTGFIPPLALNATYSNVSQTVALRSLPPSGTYYVSLLLTEFTGVSTNDGFEVIDHFDFSATWVIAGPGTVVEFYNTILDNYFITANAAEQAAIDRGSAGPGWARTGATFKSGGTALVCRFYGSISPGPNSHFYTIDAAECQSLKDQQFPAGDPRRQTVKSWNFESPDFGSTPPSGQSCPINTVPVYRAYNDGFARGVDSNHRITTNLAAIQDVVNRGWKLEGVVMCAPV